MSQTRAKTEEFFIARWLALPHRGEALILVAKEEDFPEMPVGFLCHFRDAVEHRPLEVLFHQSADGLRELKPP